MSPHVKKKQEYSSTSSKILQSFSSINPKMRENSQEKVNGWLGDKSKRMG
jgi:hypothetical protein